MADGLSKYNDKGEEIPDPNPVAVPVDFVRPVPLGERIRQLVRSETLARELAAAGIETFDEADDFDVPDDIGERESPYEDNFDPERPGAIAREQELRAGFVEDIPVERKHKARETVEKYKKKGSHKDASDSEPKKPKASEGEE